jgi:hypothetical protein
MTFRRIFHGCALLIMAFLLFGCATTQRPTATVLHTEGLYSSNIHLQFIKDASAHAVIDFSPGIICNNVDGLPCSPRRMPYRDHEDAMVHFVELFPGLHTIEVELSKLATEIDWKSGKPTVYNVVYKSIRNCHLKARLEAGHIYIVSGEPKKVGTMMKTSGNEDILSWDAWIYDKATGQALKAAVSLEEPKDLPEIQGRMATLLFFEGPPEGYRSRKDISYSLIFRSSEMRTLRWELRVIHPDPGREVKSSFETILYGPDGKEFDRRIIDATVYRGWAGSTFSGMWEDRGKKGWDKGTYRAVFLAGQKTFAECSFEVR